MKNNMLKMQMNSNRWIVMKAVMGLLCVTGCERGTTAADVGEKTGAALDTAADKTVDFTGKALDKTGEALEKAGTAVENTGENMRK